MSFQRCFCQEKIFFLFFFKGFSVIVVIFSVFELQSRQCSIYFLICNHRMDCPLWSWHSLLQRERKKGGMKGPLMKGLNTAPTPSHFSLPPSLPCPVELIWQRGGSISQFTQAACSFFFFFFLYCAFSIASRACVSTPHPPLFPLW